MTGDYLCALQALRTVKERSYPYPLVRTVLSNSVRHQRNEDLIYNAAEAWNH
jgi:DNA-directed RNA polymerase subunit F